MLLALLFATLATPRTPDCRHLAVPDAPAAEINDNRVPAGTVRDGALTVRLVAQRATWYPEGERGCGITLFAFGAEGKHAQIPGPLLRVTVGTEVRVIVRNALPVPMAVWGLRDPARAPEPLVGVTVEPESTHTFAFRASAPGTFYYWANPPANPAPVGPSAQLFAQMAGGFIVDPADEAGGLPGERILIMARWRGNPGPAGDLARRENWELTTFNGLSWPHTERLTATLGDTVRWRVIAANNDGHQMHLHGFYFLVESKGGRGADTIYAARDRRLVVTETMGPGQTIRLRWIPERPGNWIFHCHLMKHMSGYQRLDRMPREGSTPMASDPAHASHADHEMAGLVLGITVRSQDAARAETPVRRRTLHLFANRRDGMFGRQPGYGFALQEGNRAPAADSVRIPGSPLFLRRGEPTRIVVHNRLRFPVAVHWHGIELESYSDGVAGWSGAVGSIAPAIAPADSFAAEMTPPRAGTFIYHVHNETGDELAAGLYGPLVVLEPGEAPDPRHIFVIADPGPAGHDPTARPPFVNGTTTPPAQELVVGRTYRLRIITISANAFYWVRMEQDGTGYPWRAVARDGAELPPEQQVEMRGYAAAAGSTRDFEITPAVPGVLALSVDAFIQGTQLLAKPVRVTFNVRAP